MNKNKSKIIIFLLKKQHKLLEYRNSMVQQYYKNYIFKEQFNICIAG